MAYLDLGEVDRARPWIDRAAAAAAENPTPLKARRLETWRGLARACAGDAEGMRALTILENSLRYHVAGHVALELLNVQANLFCVNLKDRTHVKLILPIFLVFVN